MDVLKVKLDRDRELKFTFGALSTLARECNVNVNDPALYRAPFSPHVLSSLVWAGQLHGKDALSKAQVERYLPTDWESNIELYGELMQSLMAGRGIKPKKEENEEAEQSA